MRPHAASLCILRAALRMKALACLDASRNHGVLMSLHDTTGVLACDFTGHWVGDAALNFLNANRPALIPGRCVDVRLSGLHIEMRGGKAELRARIDACELAPEAPTHIKHRETTHLSTTEKATA